jgi:iron complex outermembrane receptor protein
MPLHGQISAWDDTIKIKEVVISGNKFISDPSGYKKTTIDSSVLFNYSSGNLSDMLSENTDIFIKSYGMGGTATPAFRGTGASHTLIDWNGIDINSPMLGQSDLSLIPVGLIDDISIYFGGASIPLNSGGIGGTINLETKPVWKRETLISMNTGMGSFGRYTGLLKVRTGNYRFQTVTKVFFQNSENNFRYLNTEISADPVWQTRTNNQVRQKGFMQEFYFRKEKNIGSVRIWYQSADRNLPASILSQQPNSGENQLDESLRTMLTYDILKGESNISLTGAWIFSRLNYFNNLASIDSRNMSEILTLKAGLQKPIGENTKLKIVLDEKSSLIRSNNYNHNESNNTATLTASVERNRGRFGTMVLLRELFNNHSILIPDFSAGLQYRLFTGKNYFIKANISRNSKIPSMNDMFWEPGGNPDLKNEYALIYEISYEMNQKISDPFNLKYDMAVFRYSIKDMIQWHPGEYSYWTADNIKTVNSTGLESSVSLDYILNNLNAALNAGYSFTKAVAGGPKIENDGSVGKQLMYIPENQFNVSFRIGFGSFYTSWMADFTGKRYITVDNSKYLPGYFINNFKTGVRLPVKSSYIDLNFNVDNLFNKNYQSIAFYPLPGRSYFIKILVQIIK